MAERTLRIRVVVDENGRARRNVRQLGTELQGVAPHAVGASAAIGGMIARSVGAITIADVFRRIATTAVSMNSQLETSTLQFESLGFSADGARAHVQSLFAFAQNTPFETQPIIEASRLMQTLGGDSLNTMENLTLVGNAAAATAQPIEQVGFWVGRMVANLQAGNPAIGEATARLLEMGVISGEGRAQLEELAKAGGSAEEVFGLFKTQVEGFGDAMQKQAETFTGLTSSLTDNISILIGQVSAPAFELFKDVIGATNDNISDTNSNITASTKLIGLLLDGVTGNTDAWFALAGSIGLTREEFIEAGRDSETLGASVKKTVQEAKRWIIDQYTGSILQSLVRLNAAAFRLVEAVWIRMSREVEALYNDLREWLLDKFGPTIDLVVGEYTRMENAFGFAKDAIITVAENLYNGVKSWIVDKFQEIVDGVKEKLDAVTGFFEDLYDDIIGNSWIPDLVTDIGKEIDRLDQVLVDRIDGQLSKIGGEDGLFAQFSGNISGIIGTIFGGGDVKGSITNLAVEGLATLADSIVPGLGEVVRVFAQFADELWNNVLKPFFSAIWDGLRAIGRGFQELFGFGGPSSPTPIGHPTAPISTPETQTGNPTDTDFGGSMAHGGMGMVTRPTLFLAGEAGPEQFAFSGAGRSFGGMGGGVNVTVNVQGGFLDSPSSQRRLTDLIERQIVRNITNSRRLGIVRT